MPPPLIPLPRLHLTSLIRGRGRGFRKQTRSPVSAGACYHAGMSTPVALSLRGLRKTYGKVVALDEFNLDVAAGECVVLIGHNGSGKTTATRIAAGQLKPTAGQATVLGSDVHRGRDIQRAR